MHLTSSEKKHTELLAPAGSFECFIAAMNAGADAVYLGLDRFGARASAVNFSQDELKAALDMAHILGRKIYLTVNTLFRDDEINELYDLLIEPYVNGLDGVIVQDYGVMAYISRHFPDLPIHVSTQAAVTAAQAAGLLRDFGVTRIVPARELSTDEIRTLKEQTQLEIECFIHGSMCYSYSGKCLLSSFIGGRSGNRGRCAQPCRLMYDGSYLMSLRDMCTIDIIPELIEAGITSFKIEGRMKNRDYVYGVTSIYRKYIDLYEKGERYVVDDKDREKLISYYTRSGNCEGYYHCHNSADMITLDSPSYTTGDAAEDGASKNTLTDRVPVKLFCTIRAGEHVSITAENELFRKELITDVIPEAAVNCALTSEDVIKQLRKSGGTFFEVTSVSVELDADLFIPNGKLNSIRRRALDAFKETVLWGYYRKRPDKDIMNAGTSGNAVYTPGNPDKSDDLESIDKAGARKDMLPPLINAAVLNEKQLKAAAEYADGLIIPPELFETVMISGTFDANDRKIYIRLPYVVREEACSNSSRDISGFIKEAAGEYDISGFYISNLETCALVSECGYKGAVIGDIHLYAYNGYAAGFVRRCGITKTTVPAELNEKELIRRGITGEELIIYGRLPMMISANCIYNTKYGCSKLPEGHDLHITDRKGEKLFVKCNCRQCTNVIYNSSILDISNEQHLFEGIRPSSVRFEFTDEKPSEIKRILDSYISGRGIPGSTDEKLIGRYTNGHIKRGVI